MGIIPTQNMEVNIMSKLSKEEKINDDFKSVWKLVEARLGIPYNWIEWRQTTGLLNSVKRDHKLELKDKFVEYCKTDNEEDHPLGSFNTDYPLIFVANNLNGEIIGEWIAPHHHYDYPSFYTDVDCSTGEIGGLTTPLILCSINLPEDFEANRKLDSLYPNIWLYSRDLFEEEPEDRYAVSEYACGGIG